jgi:hypothetical protein
MQRLITPQNRLPLHLFWLLIDNVGTPINYKAFTEITSAYKSRTQLHNAIKKIRPLLRLNNFDLTCIYGFGYDCHKTGKEASRENWSHESTYR